MDIERFITAPTVITLLATNPSGGRAALELDNVDNTSDADKPISDAAQTELDIKDSRIVRETTGRIVSVDAFAVSVFSYSGGGTIVIPANGIYYVGVCQWRKIPMILPRNIHTGWIALALVVTNATNIISIKQIRPYLHPCRTPQTMEKLYSNSAVRFGNWGSSLSEDMSTISTMGMVLNPASSIIDYRLPGPLTVDAWALGGTPNHYSLAYLGITGYHDGYGFTNTGTTSLFSSANRLPPLGRSTTVPLINCVIIGMLANGGDKYLAQCRSVVQLLQEQGKEVVIITDNAQNASYDYNTHIGAPIFRDGPELARIANEFGCALCDTAGAVFVMKMMELEGGATAYADSIHVTTGTPAGRLAAPSSGSEAKAQVIRAMFPVGGQQGGDADTTTYTYTFDSGVEGWVVYGGGSPSVAASGGALTLTVSGSAQGTWQLIGGAISAGDTVLVTYTGTLATGRTAVIGLQYGSGWNSNQELFENGSHTVTLTATHDYTGALVLFYVSDGLSGETLTLYNVQISIIHNSRASSDPTFGRDYESKPLPLQKTDADQTDPRDCFIILPQNEYYTRAVHADRGTLGAHPLGANSFARRFSSLVDSDKDLLTLAVGDTAFVGSVAALGFFLIRYAGDACEFDVYHNSGTPIKHITLDPLFVREQVVEIINPTDFANPLRNESVFITVTSGVLKICALCAQTPATVYIPYDQLIYRGTWTDTGTSMWTDTANDYAYLDTPPKGKHVQVFLRGLTNSKHYDIFSSREKFIDQDPSHGDYVFPTPTMQIDPKVDRVTIKNRTAASGGDHALEIFGVAVFENL